MTSEEDPIGGASLKEANLKSWEPERHLADNNKDSSLLPRSKTANEGLQGWRMGQISEIEVHEK